MQHIKQFTYHDPTDYQRTIGRRDAQSPTNFIGNRTMERFKNYNGIHVFSNYFCNLHVMIHFVSFCFIYSFNVDSLYNRNLSRVSFMIVVKCIQFQSDTVCNMRFALNIHTDSTYKYTDCALRTHDLPCQLYPDVCERFTDIRVGLHTFAHISMLLRCVEHLHLLFD